MKIELKELSRQEFINKVPDSLQYGPYEEDDLFMKVGNTYCCCNRHNNINNIVAYSENYDISNVNSLLTFIYVLRDKNIKYIRIASVGKDRYKHLLNRYFPNYKTEHIDNEWIHYVFIGE